MEFAANSAGLAATKASNAATTPSFDGVDYRMSATVIFEIVESNQTQKHVDLRHSSNRTLLILPR